MTMRDLVECINKFLLADDRDFLENAGEIHLTNTEMVALLSKYYVIF